MHVPELLGRAENLELLLSAYYVARANIQAYFRGPAVLSSRNLVRWPAVGNWVLKDHCLKPSPFGSEAVWFPGAHGSGLLFAGFDCHGLSSIMTRASGPAS